MVGEGRIGGTCRRCLGDGEAWYWVRTDRERAGNEECDKDALGIKGGRGTERGRDRESLEGWEWKEMEGDGRSGAGRTGKDRAGRMGVDGEKSGKGPGGDGNER